MNTLPDTLDVDSDGYPSEARLEQIRTADTVGTGARWMVETFPKLCEELRPYAYCEVTYGWDIMQEPEYVIGLSTLGWSGCEDFINAVLGNMMLNVMYYSAWRRGGHHEFRVSKSALK